MDSLTGTLTLTKPLDYETVKEYTIIVEATDQSLNMSERLTSSVTGHIIVTDANDNNPTFVIPSSSSVLISDSVTVGEVVTRIVAVDSDSGNNGRISYVISSGNEDDCFSLGYDTGVMTLMKPLMFSDSTKTFTFNISANDHGTPTRKAHFTLKLVIEGSDDNPPRFTAPKYLATVSEDASIGTYVLKVFAKSEYAETGKQHRP